MGCSAETREKIAASKRGKPLSEDHKRSISNTLRGRKLPLHVIEKMKPTWAANKGKRTNLTEDGRAKILAAHLGKKRTPEARARMSAAQRRKAPASAEARRNMSLAQQRRVVRVGKKEVLKPLLRPRPPLVRDSLPTFIYVLTDPTGSSSRIYIGQTKNKLSTRLSLHIRDARHGLRGRKNTWIRSLLKCDVIPLSTLIAEVEPGGDYQQVEIDFINHFRARYGRNVLNNTDGGDGSRGFKRSRESVEKTAAANRVRRNTPEAIARQIATRRSRGGFQISEKQRAAISAANRGKKHTVEARERMSRAQTGRKHPIEVKEKIAAAHRGRIVSLETRAKLALANLGKRASEETRRKMSLAHQKSVVASL